ncbi:MAG: phage tail sheath C-terminal domain-containing protein [Pirellulaceae bacterium]
MPSTLTYPGVYIEEIPSGVRTITGVATSTAAFVGRALRGPVNKAVTINSFGDFERIFGGLWVESKLGFAVRDFYLNGGSQAIIVRLFEPNESAIQNTLIAATTEAQTASDAVKSAVDTAAAAGGATVQSVVTAAQTAATTAGGAGPAAKAAADALAKAATDAAAVVNPAPTPATVAAAVSAAVAKAVADAAISVAPRTKAQLSAKGLDLDAAYEGRWGNYIRARVDLDVAESVATSFGLAKSDLFNLSVRDTKTGITEVFRNLTVKDSPRRVDKVLENESRLLRATPSLPTSTPQAHGDPAPGKDIFDDDTASSKVPDDKKATDGSALTINSFTGPGTEAAKQGLYALEQADLFNLLCIPPYLATDDVDSGLIDEAIKYCEKRRAMFLIDPPTAWNHKDKAKAGIENDVGAASKNAAIFFPRLRQRNPLRDNQLDDFVPSGAVAGLFARTDTNRGVWKAPAGLEATLVGVPQLSVPLTDNENGELNTKGINCLRAMPAAGRVIWGSRTRVGDDRLASEWKYIPVRRTALFVEESLYRGTQWVVFEPNDEPLWAQIRLNVGAFMHNLFRQGAFQGKSPRDAYFVKCDKESTTQNDINLGIVNIVVGFAPLKPAEFVVIKIQQMVGQIDV